MWKVQICAVLVSAGSRVGSNLTDCHGFFLCFSDAACQRADWVRHKAECSALSVTGVRGVSLQACHGEVLSNVRLTLRLSATLALSSPRGACVWRKEERRGACVKCSAEHVVDMCTGGGRAGAEREAAARLVLHFLQKVLMSYMHHLPAASPLNPTAFCRMQRRVESPPLSLPEVTSLLQKFDNNNFGITDSLLQCVGAGVYPAAALLNVRPASLARHSAACVLTP